MVTAIGKAAVLAATAVGCAAGEAAEQISDGVDVVDAVDAAGVTTDGAIFDQTADRVCEVEEKTLGVAIEAFFAMEGRAPIEAELVGTFLRTEVPEYDISPGGDVIPAPGSPCH